MSGTHSLDQERGNRAEEVASWYFRLNGFFSIPGFIVHPDRIQRRPKTEADLIAARFPYSAETLGERHMTDDDTVLAQIDPSGTRIVFALVEVKVDVCKINGPWSRLADGNMQRVIRRIGFAPEEDLATIANEMYEKLRWENSSHVLQYVAVGSRKNDGLDRRYSHLVQITFQEIDDFLFRRFRDFPEKLPTGPVHEQWPDFGRYYGEAVNRFKSRKDANNSSFNPVADYIGLKNNT